MPSKQNGQRPRPQENPPQEQDALNDLLGLAPQNLPDDQYPVYADPRNPNQPLPELRVLLDPNLPELDPERDLPREANDPNLNWEEALDLDPSQPGWVPRWFPVLDDQDRRLTPEQRMSSFKAALNTELNGVSDPTTRQSSSPLQRRQKLVSCLFQLYQTVISGAGDTLV